MSIYRLDAWAGGRHVGTLAYHDDTARFAFDYTSDWLAYRSAFPLSPALALQRSPEISDEHHSVSVRRFFENLLPEGKALDDAVAAHRLSKANLYGLLLVLGRESTGAITLLPEGTLPAQIPDSRREVTREELAERIRNRPHEPFNVWDGRVRMSIAGHQDKLAVYVENDQLYLVEGQLASTHILKPEPLSLNLPPPGRQRTLLPKIRRCPWSTLNRSEYSPVARARTGENRDSHYFLLHIIGNGAIRSDSYRYFFNVNQAGTN